MQIFQHHAEQEWINWGLRIACRASAPACGHAVQDGGDSCIGIRTQQAGVLRQRFGDDLPCLLKVERSQPHLVRINAWQPGLQGWQLGKSVFTQRDQHPKGHGLETKLDGFACFNRCTHWDWNTVLYEVGEFFDKSRRWRVALGRRPADTTEEVLKLIKHQHGCEPLVIPAPELSPGTVKVLPERVTVA
ncbi:MAG: hypothetical protein HY735_27910 [Verrucomicrobia bacterium]|nr:hypothetical protein [Verrucomicrobiota bacterium]